MVDGGLIPAFVFLILWGAVGCFLYFCCRMAFLIIIHPNIATIYTPNYIFLFFHRNIWRKYAILSTFLQPLDIQHIVTSVAYSAPRISSFALRLGVFRLAIHA